jgi:hypothetical protein
MSLMRREGAKPRKLLKPTPPKLCSTAGFAGASCDQIWAITRGLFRKRIAKTRTARTSSLRPPCQNGRAPCANPRATYPTAISNGPLPPLSEWTKASARGGGLEIDSRRRRRSGRSRPSENRRRRRSDFGQSRAGCFRTFGSHAPKQLIFTLEDRPRFEEWAGTKPQGAIPSSIFFAPEPDKAAAPEDKSPVADPGDAALLLDPSLVAPLPANREFTRRADEASPQERAHMARCGYECPIAVVASVGSSSSQSAALTGRDAAAATRGPPSALVPCAPRADRELRVASTLVTAGAMFKVLHAVDAQTSPPPVLPVPDAGRLQLEKVDAALLESCDIMGFPIAFIEATHQEAGVKYAEGDSDAESIRDFDAGEGPRRKWRRPP